MNNYLNDNQLRDLLKNIKTMVMIGVSASPLRASFFVARYFVLRGISVIPVNPNYEGQYLWGEKVLGKISDVSLEKRIVSQQIQLYIPTSFLSQYAPE